ncbi:hypothetical protein [Janthinobacterium sp. ROICE36]|nr:hypothetical protein [Janthinobacterium sp. ROICE36]
MWQLNPSGTFATICRWLLPIAASGLSMRVSIVAGIATAVMLRH